jgi:hypothetical protein
VHATSGLTQAFIDASTVKIRNNFVSGIKVLSPESMVRNGLRGFATVLLASIR